MKVKEESEKTGLKLNIPKTKIMASSSIISWQIDGETMETVADFIFLDSEITAMVTAAMKLRHWLLGKKSYEKPRQCIKKQRHSFADKSSYSQTYGFSGSHIWV